MKAAAVMTKLPSFMSHACNVINPLSPHDALKHRFTSLKTDLIFLKLAVLE